MTPAPPKKYIITEKKIQDITDHAINPFYFEDHPNMWDDVRSRPYSSTTSAEQLLDRLEHEIKVRENEMSRKAGLEENLTTATGYYTSAAALNWVRVVLIPGLRAQRGREP